MTKPLFRFTVGPCLQQGLDILAESIDRSTRTLGLSTFDWCICHNGLSETAIDFLRKSIGDRPIELVRQNWADCPINDNCQTPQRKDGSFEWNGTKCGGSLWKVCPARLRLEAHEIIMDNDIILLSKFSQIDDWLNQTEAALILEEPIRFYGRYDGLFPAGTPHLNSGFMGLPPKYDFGKAIHENWTKHGSYSNLTQADEQGLLVYTLSQQPSIRIKNTQMIEVLHRDFNTKITGKEEGIHFTQSNKIPNHHSWRNYQKVKANHG